MLEPAANTYQLYIHLGVLLLSTEIQAIWKADKKLDSYKDPQVIAEAITAFQENSRERKHSATLINAMVFPCITVGTFPTFYLVEVTKMLSDCVETAQYPLDKTVAFQHIPNTSRRRSDGMKPTGDRKKILQCFEASKVFVDRLKALLVSDGGNGGGSGGNGTG